MSIPQVEYMQLTAIQQERHTQQFYSLEMEYKEQDRLCDPHHRIVMQWETLDEMKDLKEKMGQDLVVNATRLYRNCVQTLFQSMAPCRKLNAHGEIYNEHAHLISQSPVEDLIPHAVRDRQCSMQFTSLFVFGASTQ